MTVKQVKLAIAITGGGSAAIPGLIRRGGASAWLEDYRVPYGKKALEQLLCDRVQATVCKETARRMAYAMYSTAFPYNAPWPPEKHFDTINPSSGRPFSRTFGLGVTANLTYEGERLGRKHLIYAAAYCPVPLFNDNYYLETFFIPSGQTRQDQETEADNFVKQFLAQIIHTQRIKNDT